MANLPTRRRRPNPGTRPRVAAARVPPSEAPGVASPRGAAPRRSEGPSASPRPSDPRSPWSPTEAARPSAPSRAARPSAEAASTGSALASRSSHAARPREAASDSASAFVGAAIPEHRALVCQAPSALAFDDYDATSMFQTLGKVEAVPAAEVAQAVVCRSIAEARGYEEDELFALAEVGYHYVRSGGLRLAEVIFEGLTAIAPDEPYFWLALGLVEDYLDDKIEARRCYENAARLDPEDPRPEINLAELDLERRDRRSAELRLRRGLAKAVRGRDDALERKAQALLALNGRAA